MKITHFKTAKHMFSRMAKAGLRHYTTRQSRNHRCADESAGPAAALDHGPFFRSLHPFDLSRARLAAGAGVLFLLLGGGFTSARGQAITDPNQITGLIEWNNPPGPVYSYLNSSSPPHGLAGGAIGAYSVPPAFIAQTGVPDTASHVSEPYTITVQAAVSPGIPYDVTPTMGTEDGHYYAFATATSAGVLPVSAPPVVLNFSECVGLVVVEFCDPLNNPVTVQNGYLQAYLQSSGAIQAQGGFGGVSSTTFVVRGGETFNLSVGITETTGTSQWLDLFTISYTTNFTVFVGCDQIVTNKFIVPPSPLGSGANTNTLGKIIGQVDMLTENEHWTDQGFGTMMIAENGPQTNYRYDTVEPACFYLAIPCVSPLLGTVPDNSAGAFDLPNLLPSSFQGFNQGYDVWCRMNFGIGRRYETFYSPRLDGFSINNPKVTVPPSGTVNLGNTFIMAPGWVVGDVFLCGSGEGTNSNSLLHSLVRSSDSDVVLPIGIPDTQLDGQYGSLVSAGGLNALAPGATTTASGGVGIAIFEGNVAVAGPNQGSFVGDYRLTLAGLNQQATRWDQQNLTLRFQNVATPTVPDSYIDSLGSIANHHFANVEIVPGTTITNHHRYGTSIVRITFHATSGTFFGPTAGCSGAFNGVNFEGNPADYSALFGGGGTPIDLASASADGQVVLILPEGTYNVAPTVESVNPGGTSSSHNTLLNFPLVVTPCSKICVTPEIQLVITNLPGCATNRLLQVAGSITSTTNVASIFYQLNGGTAVPVCNNCGVSQPFAFNVLLADCDNTIKVTATDVNGRVACVESTVHYDLTPPVLSGCANISTNSLAGTNGNFVTYSVSAVDYCDGPLPVNCVPPPGSFFPTGQTVVTCTAVDHCGNTNVCEFNITVTSPANCLTVTNESILCVSNGYYAYAFDIRNDTAGPVSFVSLAEVNGNPVFNPAIIYLAPPLRVGETRRLTVNLTATHCGEVCFFMALHTATFEQCCSRRLCVVLPSCCPPPVFNSAFCATNTTVIGNTNDNFAGAEPAFPSAGLLTRLANAGVTSFKGFDDCAPNSFVAHTFTNLPPCITEAALCVRLRPCGSSGNDIFGLSYTDPNGNPLPGSWSRFLGGGQEQPGLITNNWNNGSVPNGVEFCLDLSALPLAGGGTINLLPFLSQHGFLDFICQDDTTVDYLVLDIKGCCCATNKTVECGTAWTFDPPTASDGCGGTNVTVSVLSTVTNLGGGTPPSNDIEPGKEYYLVVRTPAPIVLDGSLSEWTGVPVLANPKFAVPKGSGINGTYVSFEEYAGGTWTGPLDQSSTMRVTYDDDNVYLGFAVTDEYHENSANSFFNGDSIQLMIASADRTTQVGLYNYALGGIETALGSIIIMHEAGPGGTQAIVSRNPVTHETTYEIKLPKASLGLASLADGTQFGLGAAINDGDQLTPGQKGWGGLGAHALVFGKSPSQTALLTLVGCTNIITRTWLATDFCGNTNTCSQTITVVDTVRPTIICGSDFGVVCGTAWSFTTPFASDACCGTNAIITVLNTVTNGTCPQFITRTWLVTDCCGNTNTCSQTVAVVDFTPPVFTTQCTTNHFEAGTTNDNFSGAEPTSPSPGLVARLETLGAVFKGFDDCTTEHFVAHTFNNLPPCVTKATLTIRLKTCGTILCGNDILGFSFTGTNGQLVAGSGSWSKTLGTLVADDWCNYTSGNAFVFDLAALPAGGGATDLIASMNVNGFLDVTCQDDSAVDYITLDVISCCCGTNRTLECGAPWTFETPTAYDTCSGTNITVTVLSTVTNGVCPQQITRTWQATDSCSNNSICVEFITLVDTTPPIITCATNRVLECGSPFVLEPATAWDACSGTNVTVTLFSGVTTGTFCRQTNIEVWRATDLCGNTAYCTRIVAIVDTTPPVITGCTNRFVTLTNGQLVANVNYMVAATDSCSNPVTLTCTPPAPGPFPPGTTLVTCVAVDACGNSNTCEFNVTVSTNCACPGVTNGPPSNDTPATAIPLTAPATIIGCLTYAGPTPLAVVGTFPFLLPPLSQQNAPDVWYSFSPTAAGFVTVDTCGASDCPTDTVLAIYQGSPEALLVNPPLIGGQSWYNDNLSPVCSFSPRASRVRFNARACTTYYIRVSARNASTVLGDFAVNLTQQLTTTAPATDPCIPPGNVGKVTANSSTAFNNGLATSGATPSPSLFHDLWFQFTAPPSAADATVETCATFDCGLEIYTGNQCNNLVLMPSVPVAAGCPPGSLGRRVTFPVTPGVTYRIRVGGVTSADVGCGFLRVTSGLPPINTLPVGTPGWCKTYTILGRPSGLPWSWSLTSPRNCRFNMQGNVAGIPNNGTAFDIATAFAASINLVSGFHATACAVLPCAPTPIRPEVAYLKICTPCPVNQVVLKVGAPGNPDCCVESQAFLGTIAPCVFNPGIFEIADPEADPDSPEADCNANGQSDYVDIVTGISLDADGNGVPDECPIRLYVTYDTSNNGVVISWTALGAGLEQSTSVAGPWNAVTGATSPHTAAPAAGREFFRLRLP